MTDRTADLQAQKAAARDKKRFVKLTMDGASCIVHPNELDSMLAGEELETIEQSDVWMTEAQWEALPEFEGW